MISLIRAQLRFRRGRLVATIVAVAVAVASFALLASASRGSQVRVTGTVKENFRPMYDILVRPPAATTENGLISTDRVSSTYGGISEAQWRRILDIQGVSVAAPVAMAGYVMQTAVITVDLTEYAAQGGRQVLKLRPTYAGDRGLSSIPDGSKYLYVTPNNLEYVPGEPWVEGKMYTNADIPKAPEIHEHGPNGVTAVCEHQTGYEENVKPLAPEDRTEANCWSSDPASSANTAKRAQVQVLFPIPLLLAAVDPAQEAKLDRLDGAVTSGAYLPESDQSAGIPVLASGRLDLDQQVRIEIERLGGDAAERTAAGMRLDNAAPYYDTMPATPLASRSYTAQDVYPALLDAIAHPVADLDRWPTQEGTSVVGEWWTTSPMTLSGPGRTADVVPYSGGEWGKVWHDIPAGKPLPMGLADDPVRAIVRHGTDQPKQQRTFLRGVGVYDPAKVQLGPELSRPPFDLYAGAEATGADPAARKALGDRALQPTTDFAGPLGQRPHLLTTLSALAKLQSAPYESLDAAHGVNKDAPISMVRVRVAGDVGIDAFSQERVRAIADQIHLATGLRVDLVGGSSAAGVAEQLPAGQFGRPALAVRENWLRLGVATTIVAAVDRKSLVLAILVLIACALAVGNAASAAVRTRATELGVLACLGWARWRLFALVTGESVTVGAVAGLLGTILALALSRLLGVSLGADYALLAIPAALLLSGLAALPPAWRATRADPGAAVRPAVVLVRRRRVPRRVSGLAMGNVLRSPGRTVLGAVSLALGIAALTLLVIINLTFQGSVSGTVLGDAITVQVQSTDYIAAVLTTLLGAATVADVLYVNIRERAAEFALLGAVGWADAPLARLAAYEALAIGVLGATTGVGVALGTAALLSSELTAVSYAVAAAAALAGALLAVAAAILPVRTLRRLPTARLLAEE
ncbi:ABC transporter permease [Dactylosporangium salmoneum]|uniref:ABC3 transporter permease C-terminal domain-containing protein n=1 Tax=Dactylosporangium salmoneum TaxID=53361 RepID=A0ABP5TV02_9ACTN